MTQISSTGCDLLSIFELHSTHNNLAQVTTPAVGVVICFRSLNYIRLITTIDDLQTH